MRFLRIVSIAIIALFTVFIITYNARVSVINTLIKEHLSQYQVKINCLDISLSGNLTLIVNKLCLQSPKADIEITDMLVQWQMISQFKINNVNVKQAKIKGTDHLFSNTVPTHKNNNHHNKKQTINQLLSTTLEPYLKQINQFELPTNINIAELYYLPFSQNVPKQDNIKQPFPYIASLSVIGNTLSLTLKTIDKITIIELELNKFKSEGKLDLSLTLSGKLASLKTFINTHNLPITAQLQDSLNNNEVSGQVDTVIEYKADTINIQAQVKNFTVASNKESGEDKPYKLVATLDIKSQLQLASNKKFSIGKGKTSNKIEPEITLSFTGKNLISIENSKSHISSLLEQSQVSSTIISIFKDNPITQLTLKPKSNATLTIHNKQLNLSGIELTASGDDRVHQIALDNVMFNFIKNDNALTKNNAKSSKRVASKNANEISVENFIIDSQLKLSNIVQFTTAPITLHLEGSLIKAETQSKLNLNKNSFFTVKHIMLAKQQSKPTSNTKEKVLLELQTLSTKIEGELQLKSDNTLNVNLKAHSQASQIALPKILQIKSFNLISDITGNPDNIHLNATASADGVNLGKIIIDGPALSPMVQLKATKLKLTDLLSLNIQLPIGIELIDGTLNYRISGQLTDIAKFDKNLFNISVEFTSVSGEIDDIWIEELNWHQNFTLLGNNISSLPSDTENLTVGLIDIPTPISMLSTNTYWSYNQELNITASNLKADILGGSFAIPTIKWPFTNGRSANVQLNSIDLEKVLALDKKQGIVVTGNISGQVPITFDGKKYIIEKGELHNINNGLIQIMNNPATEALVKDNTQLQLAFDALKNLHYHQLSSSVSMEDSGYMLLETVIKGHNPDIDNDVNLNLNLSYDLLGLLESMSITQRFEDNIIKDLQKGKK